MGRNLAWSSLLGRCDVPRINARDMDWNAFKAAGLRHSAGVMLTGLFDEEELLQWRREEVLKRHGNETFYADDTRGNYAHPKLGDYIQAQRNDRMIFVSNTLRGAFGRAWRQTLKRKRRRKLLEDFAERPIFSVGVSGGAVPTHEGHPETWHLLLSGVKAWWLSATAAAGNPFSGWEDPCGAIEALLQETGPSGPTLCVQHPGEVLYFGDNVEHATCSLSDFSLAVGAQGHTERWPPLLRASNRGDHKEVQRLLASSPGAVSETAGRYGHSALHRAALHGFAEVVKELLKARADPKQRDDEGLAPGFLGAFSGHVKVLEALGGEVAHSRDAKGASPLQWAATQGHLEVVDFLLSRKADVSATNALGGGAVAAAATTGHGAVLRRLVEAKGSVEEADQRGLRPLHWSSLHGHAEVVRSLLTLRAAPRASVEGQTPLDLARSPEVQVLLKSQRKGKGGAEL